MTFNLADMAEIVQLVMGLEGKSWSTILLILTGFVAGKFKWSWIPAILATLASLAIIGHYLWRGAGATFNGGYKLAGYGFSAMGFYWK